MIQKVLLNVYLQNMICHNNAIPSAFHNIGYIGFDRSSQPLFKQMLRGEGRYLAPNKSVAVFLSQLFRYDFPYATPLLSGWYLPV